MKRSELMMWSCALICLTGVLPAQTKASDETTSRPKFYRLDFVVQEVEGGKVMNERSYSMIASTESQTIYGPATKSPSPSGSAHRDPITYAGVGVNIDCSAIQENANELAFDVSADVSSMPVSACRPRIARRTQVLWSARTAGAPSVVTPLRKPTVIFRPTMWLPSASFNWN